MVTDIRSGCKHKTTMARIKGRILAIDDNAGIRSALQILLPLHFSDVRILPSPNGLMTQAEEFRPDVVLLDMNFHRDINTGNEGLFWLSELKSRFRDVEVVLFTAYADVALAVEGMKRGAFDFVVKPWENDRLIATLEKACLQHRKGNPATGNNRDRSMFWGGSQAMAAIKRTIEKIAPTDASVLITGENGVGKDVLAGEIHRLSARSGHQMVGADIGAIAETLFESELFGHVKGAFTDAKSDHAGLFEQASGSTLFLDEIGNIPLHLQAKLLRVLQNRAVTKVGDTRPVPVDIRLICATNMDLEGMVADGKFREDLWYRINTIHIAIPPLRERKDEILPLAEMFLDEFAAKYRRDVHGIGTEAAGILLGQPWKGNVRELRNCIEKAVIMSEGTMLSADDLTGLVAGPQAFPDTEREEPDESGRIQQDGQQDEETLEMIEEKAIRNAMMRYNGNLSMVARSLDISRPTLYSKLKKYGI